MQFPVDFFGAPSSYSNWSTVDPDPCPDVCLILVQMFPIQPMLSYFMYAPRISHFRAALRVLLSLRKLLHLASPSRKQISWI